MRLLRALPIWIAALAAATFAHAQPVVSPGPDGVSVAIYRAPYRDADEAIELDSLEGYALVTETRTVTIPAGRATIRFEGVAGGILPESAIVTGLPAGVREKNLDADLLSPRSLYARSYGRPVTIRYRDRAGKEISERAIIRSGSDGAAIFETAHGFVTADCRGDGDQIVYDSVPAGLSAKPTLSIETESPRAGQVTLTLSYLAWGFDWQANYVATMRPGGKTADLFAWVTLASSDVTSFENAQAMVVAGKPNREDEFPDARDSQAGELSFLCFATGERRYLGVSAESGFPAPAPPVMAIAHRDADEKAIIVTGSVVRQEDLGDLKLYRVPHATTVAAMSQKQVAMLDRPAVRVAVIYRSRIHGDAIDDDDSPVRLVLRARNKKEQGLGVPLPGGSVALFEADRGRRLLIGEGAIGDKAVGEEVEVEMAPATQVHAGLADGDGDGGQVLTVTNANPFSIRYEAEIALDEGERIAKASARLRDSKGRKLWAVEVPAGGTARLTYRLREED